MTGTSHSTVFEAERGRLVGLAYRTLGSRTEAEDVVQDAWLRFAATDLDTIHQPAAWLTTVVVRLCLDVLRSARVRRESYVGPWLPEPLVSRLGSPADPVDSAVQREEVSMALLVVLERLTPEQRVAFVLHDVFAVPFDEIATMLSTTSEAARQQASRARRLVAGQRTGPTPTPTAREEQRRAVEAFLAAAHSGDFEALLAVLAPDVLMIGDGGGVAPAGTRPIEGAVPVSRFVLGLFRRARAEMLLDLDYVLVNGEVGLVVEVRAPGGGRLPAPAGVDLTEMRFVMAFSVDNGRITAIFDQLNPAKLARVPTLAEIRDPARPLP